MSLSLSLSLSLPTNQKNKQNKKSPQVHRSRTRLASRRGEHFNATRRRGPFKLFPPAGEREKRTKSRGRERTALLNHGARSHSVSRGSDWCKAPCFTFNSIGQKRPRPFGESFPYSCEDVYRYIYTHTQRAQRAARYTIVRRGEFDRISLRKEGKREAEWK